MEVVCQLVVFHQTTILCLIGRNDREIRLVNEPVPMNWLPMQQVGATFLLQYVGGNPQFDHAIDRAGHMPSTTFLRGASLVPLGDPQLIAQEMRSLRPS